MRNILAPTLAILLAALPARAVPTCRAFGIADYVKAYLHCQGNTRLLACAGLTGAAVAGVATPLARKLISAQGGSPLIQLSTAHEQWRAGRVLAKPKHHLEDLKSRLVSTGDAGVRAEAAALTRAIAAAEATGAPVYAPLVRVIDGASVDVANTAFKDLPQSWRDAAAARQKLIESSIQRQVARGQTLTEAFKKTTAAIADERFPSLPARSSLSFVENAARAAEAEELKAATRSSVASLLKRALAAGAPAVLGGLAGVALAAPATVAGQIASASATACDDVFSKFINQDAGHACRFEPKINVNVVQFLDRPEAEQIDIMKRHPEVCAFYEQLHKKLFDFASDQELRCEGLGVDQRRVILKAKIDGEAREYQTQIRADGTVASVRVLGDQGPRGLFTFVNAVDELKTPAVPGGEAWEEFRHLKMILPDAISCCATPNPNFCLRQYTKPGEGDHGLRPGPAGAAI